MDIFDEVGNKLPDSKVEAWLRYKEIFRPGTLIFFDALYNPENRVEAVVESPHYFSGKIHVKVEFLTGYRAGEISPVRATDCCIQPKNYVSVLETMCTLQLYVDGAGNRFRLTEDETELVFQEEVFNREGTSLWKTLKKWDKGHNLSEVIHSYPRFVKEVI